MRHNTNQKPTSFFVTSPVPCPYLQDKTERRLVADLFSQDPVLLNNKLSRAGLREDGKPIGSYLFSYFQNNQVSTQRHTH